MTVHESILLVRTEHAHLEVLLEDLAAIAQLGFRAPDETLLEDARATWAHLRDGLPSHFLLEEHAFSTLLEGHAQQLGQCLESLHLEHATMKALVDAVGSVLLETVQLEITRHSAFELVWTSLCNQWQEHSRHKWELLLSLLNHRHRAE